MAKDVGQHFRITPLALALIVTAALGAALYAGYTWADAPGSRKSLPMVGYYAPELTLTDANGVKANLSDYRGKVVFLSFMASW